MAPATSQRTLVLAHLRDEIRRIERRPGRRAGVIPCGLASVDEALPAGGFPRGALSELRGGPSSGKTAVALSLVAALAREELAAYVDGTGELYPPAAVALGVDLGRLLVVRPMGAARRGPAGGRATGERGAVDPGFWAAEALLASAAFAAVVIDVALPRRGADGLLRRLQMAAEKGGAIGLWLSRPGEPARVPAGARLDLALRGGRIVATRDGRAISRAEGDGHAA